MKDIRKFLSSSKYNFQQQTFLGCTVKDFNVNGGFGDSASTLHVELVPDEYNKSDCTYLNEGDDIYHDGISDKFNAPLPGSPVFFKFGPTFASIKKAFMPEYNFIYGTNIEVVETLEIDREKCPEEVPPEDCAGTEENVEPSGVGHFVFGGIIQSYGKSSSTGGDPIYNVTVNDPREILSNVTLILANYANTVFGLPNVMNVYGFLEYNPSTTLRDLLNTYYTPSPYLFTKSVTSAGVSYSNGLRNMPLLTDAYITSSFLQAITPNLIQTRFVSLGDFPHIFPYTGTSYSRRGETGIPVYRVIQAIYAMMGFYGPLPIEYQLKNFGGMINFRGFKYVVDLSGIPFNKIPPAYMLDFDQMNLLEFCQEICDVISHDLHVTLLPLIDHPVTSYVDRTVAGIIRVNAIDRSHVPNYGAISRFIEQEKNRGVEVTNSDIGLELSNIPTDKFIVGAQEVNMHYFHTNEDRHQLQLRKANYGLTFMDREIPEQWFISNALRQQILPFYGFLGNDALTIPRGYGPYQQILLDSTGLNANGVGNYYVATQMELRAALVSYEEWKKFLLQYNDLYMEEISPNSNKGIKLTDIPPEFEYIIKHPMVTDAVYAVAVPRCVFRSDRNYLINNRPASSCSPPYGYPLYYKRAEMIGLPDKGLAGYTANNANLISAITKLTNTSTDFIEDAISTKLMETILKDYDKMSPEDQKIIDKIKEAYETNDKNEVVRILREYQSNSFKKIIPSKELRKRQANSMKIYEFVKQAAQNLGTKWLVKIPKLANPYYSNVATIKGVNAQRRVFEIEYGPYGFIPRDVLGNINSASLELVRQVMKKDVYNTLLTFGAEDSAFYALKKRPVLEGINVDITQGALKVNYDYIKESYVFNYEPEPQGGFLHNDLYSNLLSSVIKSDLQYRAVIDGFIPLDPTPLMTENRISSYVRFNNSQYLDLSSLPKESYTQMQVNGDHIMPDILLDLDNEHQDKMVVDQDLDEFRRTRPITCAFIKCELDARFYMPPRYMVIRDKCYGVSVKDEGYIRNPQPVFDKTTGLDSVGIPLYVPNWVPSSSGTTRLQEDFVRYYDGVFMGDIVATDPLSQDTNHVYALITLPGLVGTIIDRKFEQAQDESKNIDALLHMLLQDTVSSRVPGFDSPPLKTINDIANWDPSTSQEWKRIATQIGITSDFVENWKTQATREKYALALKRETVTFPSPVAPDLIAIPLRSNERCYGPWISSFTKPEASQYRNIPGKVEFIKDENLAPWNYGGYDLMNQAGLTYAEFSSSLLLYEEKGSVTIADIPRGNSLLRPLVVGGPLITNIDVRIGADGITTTYNMSTYSPRFGNLQKQRIDMISKISRDRQKLLDNRNDYIRRGLGKLRRSYSDNDFLGMEAISNIAFTLQNSTERPEPKKIIQKVGNEQVYSDDTVNTTYVINVHNQNTNNAVSLTDTNSNVAEVPNPGVVSVGIDIKDRLT